jgi:hypothetical protein
MADVTQITTFSNCAPRDGGWLGSHFRLHRMAGFEPSCQGGPLGRVAQKRRVPPTLPTRAIRASPALLLPASHFHVDLPARRGIGIPLLPPAVLRAPSRPSQQRTRATRTWPHRAATCRTRSTCGGGCAPFSSSLRRSLLSLCSCAPRRSARPRPHRRATISAGLRPLPYSLSAGLVARSEIVISLRHNALDAVDQAWSIATRTRRGKLFST